MAFPKITSENVYLCTGHPLDSDIKSVVHWALNDSFQKAYTEIKNLQVSKGLALQDILTEVHRFCYKIDFDGDDRIFVLDKLAIVEERLASGSDENIQRGALVSAFCLVR